MPYRFSALIALLMLSTGLASAFGGTDSQLRMAIQTEAMTVALAAPEPKVASLTIEVTGVQTDRGHILVALYTKPDTWTNPDAAFATRKVDARKGVVSVTFGDLPAGSYAIAVMHDADDDGEMTTGLFSIPKEAYGFGNDARAPFSAPSFGESVVLVSRETKVVVNIK